jgi:hypothetical protein
VPGGDEECLPGAPVDVSLDRPELALAVQAGLGQNCFSLTAA